MAATNGTVKKNVPSAALAGDHFVNPAKVKKIREAFPQISDKQASLYLTENKGNLKAAMDKLLEDKPGERWQSVKKKEAPKKKAEVPVPAPQAKSAKPLRPRERTNGTADAAAKPKKDFVKKEFVKKPVEPAAPEPEAPVEGGKVVSTALASGGTRVQGTSFADLLRKKAEPEPKPVAEPPLPKAKETPKKETKPKKLTAPAPPDSEPVEQKPAETVEPAKTAIEPPKPASQTSTPAKPRTATAQPPSPASMPVPAADPIVVRTAFETQAEDVVLPSHISALVSDSLFNFSAPPPMAAPQQTLSTSTPPSKPAPVSGESQQGAYNNQLLRNEGQQQQQQQQQQQHQQPPAPERHSDPIGWSVNTSQQQQQQQQQQHQGQQGQGQGQQQRRQPAWSGQNPYSAMPSTRPDAGHGHVGSAPERPRDNNMGGLSRGRGGSWGGHGGGAYGGGGGYGYGAMGGGSNYWGWSGQSMNANQNRGGGDRYYNNVDNDQQQPPQRSEQQGRGGMGGGMSRDFGGGMW